MVLAVAGLAMGSMCVCKSLPFSAKRAAAPRWLNRFGK